MRGSGRAVRRRKKSVSRVRRGHGPVVYFRDTERRQAHAPTSPREGEETRHCKKCGQRLSPTQLGEDCPGRPDTGDVLDRIAATLNMVVLLERRARNDGTPLDDECRAWLEAKDIVTQLLEAERRPREAPDDDPERQAREKALQIKYGIEVKPEGPLEAKRRRRHLLAAAASNFTARAHDAHRDGGGVVLEVRADPKTGALRPVVMPFGVRGRVQALLWEHVFTDEAWRRLRHCDRCWTWFVDHSDSQTGRFCTESCRMRWHTREKRRKAKQQKMQHPKGRLRRRR